MTIWLWELFFNIRLISLIIIHTTFQLTATAITLSTYGDISCLKNHLWQLSFRLKHSIIKSEISVSDLSNLWIFRIWKILASPGGRTMHPGRLIMKYQCCRKLHFWQLLFRLWSCTTKSERIIFFKCYE